LYTCFSSSITILAQQRTNIHYYPSRMPKVLLPDYKQPGNSPPSGRKSLAVPILSTFFPHFTLDMKAEFQTKVRPYLLL
ncbi:MAG: hypothetical protein SO101_09060, partial [Lachnospiraceae bacterium]|nr:hypothetical protein [Lachnospiraceae bacterium]